jgi:NAD(P)-dependent dehydrogenase (short-subunit alcohol dehydrogenase family)
MPKIENFKDKVVVVTGAASGIGEAISRRFAKSGARLGLLDMDAEAVAALASDVASGGTKVVDCACDVANENDCSRAVQRVLHHFGGIDILINNAGITQRSAFEDTAADVFKRVMDVNFFGSLYCTRFALSSLIERRGQIVVIESVGGIAPVLGRSGYCASKHALHGLFTTLRAELRSKQVSVTIVCPGFVKTNLQDRALGGDGRVTAHPQSRVGRQITAASVAEAVIKAVTKRKPLVLLTPVAHLTYWMTRLVPTVYERLMARQLREELDR